MQREAGGSRAVSVRDLVLAQPCRAPACCGEETAQGLECVGAAAGPGALLATVWLTQMLPGVYSSDMSPASKSCSGAYLSIGEVAHATSPVARQDPLIFRRAALQSAAGAACYKPRASHINRYK